MLIIVHNMQFKSFYLFILIKAYNYTYYIITNIMFISKFYQYDSNDLIIDLILQILKIKK